MTKALPRYYWDSACFIAWLKPEKNRQAQCREVLASAENGELLVVTSAVALVEVIKLDKGPLQISRDKRELITRFFQNEWILVVQVTRAIGEQARNLVWAHGMKPRDSLHLATAMWAKDHGGLEEIHTFDAGLLKLSEQFGDETLPIVEPRARQPQLFTSAQLEGEDPPG